MGKNYSYFLDTFFGLALLVGIGAHASVDRPNGVMMQYFHWYSAGYQSGTGLWKEIEREAPKLASKGISALWLPPAYKGASGVQDVGYGVYDRYDLGEFNQRGSIPTKYGTLQDYQAAIASAHRVKIDVYGDIVLNQMLGADGREKVRAVEVYPTNRNAEIPGTEREILAETFFDFPSRGGRYSPFIWHWTDFTGSDIDFSRKRRSIFKFRGDFEGFQEEVDHENGNYDYLLGADLDVRNPEVNRELITWGKWYVSKLKLDGMRLDAVKHMPFQFITRWLKELRRATGKELLTVGEYWSYEVGKLKHYLNVTQGSLSLFDAPLHLNFVNAGRQNGFYDLRKIFDGSLVQTDPTHAVTLVDNHDTQALQSLQSPVPDWFKPLAYALILLREQGYPCIFYPDYYGATYTDQGQTIRMPSFRKVIDVLLYIRYKYAYGPQRDYFDHPDVIGWTREGDADHSSALGVLISDNRFVTGTKRMCFAPRSTSGLLIRQRRFVDFTRSIPEAVILDSQGCGIFSVRPASFSAWIENYAQ